MDHDSVLSAFRLDKPESLRLLRLEHDCRVKIPQGKGSKASRVRSVVSMVSYRIRHLHLDQ